MAVVGITVLNGPSGAGVEPGSTAGHPLGLTAGDVPGHGVWGTAQGLGLVQG